MDYKDDFFDGYKQYLTIPEVAAGHKRVFDLFMDYVDPWEGQPVNDMGCGSCEFGRYLQRHRVNTQYKGFDLDITRADLGKGKRGKVQVGDYTQVMPDVGALVVSLFATEIHLPWDEHEALYAKWKEKAQVKHIMVAGFYYEHAPDEPSIIEHTGYQVYQTIRSQPLAPGELRLIQQVPAGMFVDPFIEVWRLL